MTRRWRVFIRRGITPFLFTMALAFLLACGGTNNLTLQNPAAPASTPVTIAFQPAPVASITLAGTATLTAVVDNDPNHLGVDWSLLCSVNANCGTISSQHTASGSPVTYTPPPVISGNEQTFTIEAFATADNTKNVVANLAVNGFAGVLKGTYVFATKGIDGNGPFQLAGIVVLDGNGAVTGGEQTHSDPLRSVSDAITGGTYFVGPDSRGSLSLTTADANIGQQGIENLSLVVLSNSEALLATIDNPNLPPSFETSSGSLELQTSKAAPVAGYAFAVSGVNAAALPMAVGGILNVHSPGVISASGSVADEYDASTLTVNSNATVSGTVTQPDSMGSVKFNLTASFSSTPIQFTGYILNAQHIKLIETDSTGSGIGFGSTSGIAIGQGAATGTFLANSVFAGTYVLGILGSDFSGYPTSMALTGEVTADVLGNLSSGFADEFVEGTPAFISDSLTGTYTLDPSGNGRVDSQISFTKHQPAPELIFYLTGNGNPPVVLSLDTTLGTLGFGMANPQTTSAIAFNGKYGLSFTQGVSALENDSTAQISVNASAGTLSGIVDSNLAFNGQLDTPLTGTFTSETIPGRFSGTLSNTLFPSPESVSGTLSMDFWLIDSTQGYFIETDSLKSAQLTFGYLAARTPVCPTCH